MTNPAHVLPRSRRSLVVLGCSATKHEAKGPLPAVSRYDGPAFRVLRNYLRERRWSRSLSVAVLSAKHGLIGGIAPVAPYDLRMTSRRASELHSEVMTGLKRFSPSHRHFELVLGKDYLSSVSISELDHQGTVQVTEGSIGEKLSRLHTLLRELPSEPRQSPDKLLELRRPLYFLPDWDDFLDVDFDFEADEFSSTDRASRNEAHSIGLMRPDRLCDGVLVSLAQHLGSKGLLKRVDQLDETSLAPRSVREHFALRADQWAFGDCGAFSYVSEDKPTISVEQAVSLYDLYDFDLGASVDHIPVTEVSEGDGSRKLSYDERRARVVLTQQNAQRFIDEHRIKRCAFIPVGVIQGISAKGYARQVPEYVEMGYRYVALGGLVPRTDADILGIVESVVRETKKLREQPKLHLLGVFRPELQKRFRRLGIASFDSATYFRKAWLRSDQNYVDSHGKWYSAIRVPPTRDARTMKRLQASGVGNRQIRNLETRALNALHQYDSGEVTLESCLRTVLAYDSLLSRGEYSRKSLREDYRRTLKDKPWDSCECSMCKALGIDIAVFRGYNRNKRRGAHNTLQLFRDVTGRR